jgi:hypothetical protein
MVQVSVKDLKESKAVVDEIRWDVTPRLFMSPSSPSGETVDITHGYMLYIDLVNNKPSLVIMQLRRIMSKTVGYVNDVPEDLLRESMHCVESECIGGMYPLSENLTNWLKKEFGVH